MEVKIDREFNQIITNEIIPELHEAFAHLIVGASEIKEEKILVEVINEKANQTKEELDYWIDSLRRYSIENLIMRKEAEHLSAEE